MMRTRTATAKWVVNVSDLTAPGAKFVELPRDVRRLDYSGLPRNAVERLISRPKISRYRAALEAVFAAKGRPIISHLPRMTAAVSSFQSLTGRRSPHLAFSFNFTDLPGGAARKYLSRSFLSVDEFFVFSAYERGLYSDHFALPSERFTRLIWTQDPPPVSSNPSPLALNSYVSAIGGEGRDYETLIAAAEKLQDIEFVIIARPYNSLPRVPANVRVLVNVPLEQTWRMAVDSSCMVVPLKTRTTCCGHITLVAGELLGIPLISTFSEATREYTEDVALCDPGDADALASLIRHYHQGAVDQKAAASARVRSKREKYDRRQWDVAVGRSLERYL